METRVVADAKTYWPILTYFFLCLLFHLVSIDGDHHLFKLVVRPPCWPNQSGNIWCATYILRLWAFRILDGIVLLYIGFIVCLPDIFALVWSIRVTIPVKLIPGFGNPFRCTILITLCWMIADSSESVAIQYFSSSARKVLCRHTWCHTWFFPPFQCRRTIMCNDWPGHFNQLLRDMNVTNGCHLLVSSVRFLHCSILGLGPCHICSKWWTLAILCSCGYTVTLFIAKSCSVSVISNAGLSPANIPLLG